MANEIKVRPYVSLTKVNAKIALAPGTISITQTGNGFYHNVSSIGTSEESIATFGDVASEGIVYIRNLDATNYVQIGFATGVYGMRLAAGHIAQFTAEPGLTVYFKANTAACNVEVFVAEV